MKKQILEVTNLTKYYGNVLGVKEVSFSLEEGEVFGFIGPNGSGKSTTIRSIMNLIEKTQGKVTFLGEELLKNKTELKKLIGYLPSEIHLYEDYTVKEMLDYHASFYQENFLNRKDELVKYFELDESKKIENLSLGNLKKLGIVLALMHQPKLLILDEPTSGLDPIMQQKFYDLIKEEKKKGTTIFYSTHILSEISKICDRVGIIKNGCLVAIEKMEALQKKNFLVVTIESEDAESILKELKLKNYELENHMLKFQNHLEMNVLLKKLTKYKINKLLIEEATLESMFMNYYK